MSRLVVINPGVEEGVDTKCCRRRIPEILTALVTTEAETCVCQIVFDPESLGDCEWRGVARLGNQRNGDSTPPTSLRLQCSRMGWRIGINGMTPEPARVEESWPLYLEFSDVEAGSLRWFGITITE